MLQESLYFFEQTDFSLRFARCAITETSLNIEELKEIPVTDPAVFGQLAPAGTQVVCALRPKPRQLHLATTEEAKRYSGLAGLQQFAQSALFAKNEPAWFAGVQASDGTAPANAPWLISLSSAAAHQQSRAVFETAKLKPARCLDATLATVGALASSVTNATLLLEIGELGSHAFLIGPEGVLAARAVSLNLDQIAEAVQTELNLKFRGSAAKLFFNPDCDFTDTGAKIAARIGATLKADLIPLFAGKVTPTMFSCAGLPALQHWLEVQLAPVLGLTPYIPDIKVWSAAVGVTFGSPTFAASVSPAWFNFLHFINSQTLESPAAVAWQAEWVSTKGPVASHIPRPATNPPFTAAAHRPTAAKSAVTPPVVVGASVTAAPAGATKATQVSAAKSSPSSLPKPAAPLQNKAAAVATLPSPPKSTTVPAAKAAVITVSPQAKAAVSSVQYSPKPAIQPAASTALKKNSAKNKMPLFVGIAILVLVLLGGGFYFLQSQKEETARIALEKQKVEQRAKAEEERARLAEQKARQESESRKKFELETSQKLAVAENARRQAEDEARAQTASRLANARGTLIVTTQPAGATVTLGDLPSKPSPATFNYVKIGKYPVTITLAHHEEMKLEFEVTENNTTESGVISLASLVGSVAITSEPTGSSYEIRPANSFAVTNDARQTGQTPATLDNLDPGEYSVIFSRAGWAPHTQTVSITRDATSQVAWTFPSGSVKIVSSPTGATVTQDGLKLGITPLTLRQAPGRTQYELKLAFHDPVTLPAFIEEGKNLELTAQLPAIDVIFGPSELDKNPEPINPKTPALPSSLTLVEGRVVIQMTINRDGNPSDLKLVRSSNSEIGKIYMTAVAKWKFKPGVKDGKPVRSAVVVPFLINPSKD